MFLICLLYSSILALHRILVRIQAVLYGDKNAEEELIDAEKALGREFTSQSTQGALLTCVSWIDRVAKHKTLRSALRDLPPSAAQFGVDLVQWVIT